MKIILDQLMKDLIGQHRSEEWFHEPLLNVVVDEIVFSQDQLLKQSEFEIMNIRVA